MNARVRAAVENNARWCDIVCRSHGLPTEMSEHLWVTPQGSPPLYPDAVTLVPAVAADVVLKQIDNRPGSSVKDSFADVDLGSLGFIELFEARWLFREPAPARTRTRLRWDTVMTEVEFAQWVSSAELGGDRPSGAVGRGHGALAGRSRRPGDHGRGNREANRQHGRSIERVHVAD